MHVDGNKRAERTGMIATLAIMAAVSTILLVLGTLISINTVFFTAMAAFIVGIIVVKYGFGAGLMLYIGCALLDLLLNPDKFHVLLYVAMAGFTLLAEGSYKLLEKKVPDPKKRNIIHIACRIVVFMAGYIPLIVFIPRLFLAKTALDQFYQEDWIVYVMIGIGFIAFIVYDLAYVFVKRTYMNVFKVR